MKPIHCVHRKTGKNFIVIPEDEYILCSACGKTIELGATIYVYKAYSKVLPFKKEYFCTEVCARKRVDSEQTELNNAICTSVIPENVIFISDMPSMTTYAKEISVFQAVNLESIHTTDNTRYAYRESLEGARIGDVAFIRHKPGKHRYLNDEELCKQLEMHKESKPVLPKVLQ